jgi:hypothetical protein
MELGEAIGWRAWRVVETEDEELLLASVLHDDLWPVGEPLEAECAEGHLAPAFDCACGIYAARSPAAALPYRVGRDDPGVVGRVLGLASLGGDVVEHRHGWRASHGYPLVLWAPPLLAERLAGYGVDVRKLAAWASASSTRRIGASAGSRRSGRSCSAARTRFSPAAASGSSIR